MKFLHCSFKLGTILLLVVVVLLSDTQAQRNDNQHDERSKVQHNDNQLDERLKQSGVAIISPDHGRFPDGPNRPPIWENNEHGFHDRHHEHRWGSNSHQPFYERPNYWPNDYQPGLLREIYAIVFGRQK